MKTLIAACLFLAPTVASAQTPAPAPAATAGLSLDSPIATLMADPGAKAVVLASLPNIESEPGYDQFKVVSLRRLQPHAGGKITDEQITAIEAGLKTLPQE